MACTLNVSIPTSTAAHQTKITMTNRNFSFLTTPTQSKPWLYSIATCVPICCPLATLLNRLNSRWSSLIHLRIHLESPYGKAPKAIGPIAVPLGILTMVQILGLLLERKAPSALHCSIQFNSIHRIQTATVSHGTLHWAFKTQCDKTAVLTS